MNDQAPNVQTDPVDRLEALGARIAEARAAVADVLFGQDDVIDQALVTLLAGGHMLVTGVPGLGKTLLVETLGTVLGLDENRVQFTPDLMPADILGSEVLEETEEGSRFFRFVRGPVFCQLLMADEINRASPRTQSALLQSMQEYEVSIAGDRHALPRPFHVLATQNPLEHEGTYPLPEAQLDRFFMRIDIDYPGAEAEKRLVVATTGVDAVQPRQILSGPELMEAQQLIRHVPVGDKVVDAILTLVRNGRPGDSPLENVRRYVTWGPGPRASQALMLGARARCVAQGRLAPSLDDVMALARPVLRHRMALHFAARAEGISVEKVIDELCESVS